MGPGEMPTGRLLQMRQLRRRAAQRLPGVTRWAGQGGDRARPPFPVLRGLRVWVLTDDGAIAGKEA